MSRPKVNWIEDEVVSLIEAYIIRKLRENNEDWVEAKLVELQAHIKAFGVKTDTTTISRRLKWLVENDYLISRRKYPNSIDATLEYSRTPEQEERRPDVIKSSQAGQTKPRKLVKRK